MTMQMYQVKEVQKDYIVLEDTSSNVKITFAEGSGSYIEDNPAMTKEENAAFFRGIKCPVGMEAPVVPLNMPRVIDLFLDHRIDMFGSEKVTPFQFPVSCIEVLSLTTS